VSRFLQHVANEVKIKKNSLRTKKKSTLHPALIPYQSATLTKPRQLQIAIQTLERTEARRRKTYCIGLMQNQLSNFLSVVALKREG